MHHFEADKWAEGGDNREIEVDYPLPMSFFYPISVCISSPNYIHQKHSISPFPPSDLSKGKNQ